MLTPIKKLLYALPTVSPGVRIKDPGLENPILELQNIAENNIETKIRSLINRLLLLILINHIVQNQYHISSSLVCQIPWELLI